MSAVAAIVGASTPRVARLELENRHLRGKLDAVLSDLRKRDKDAAGREARIGELSRQLVQAEAATVQAERRLTEAEQRRLAALQKAPAIEIMAEIAEQHGVPMPFLIGRSRSKRVVIARHHAMYEVQRICKLGAKEIARLFGNRDHTTVMYAVWVWPGKARHLGIACEPIYGVPHKPMQETA